ncbi:TcpE family conjugal transfer membrane protein [Nocardiopsis valliformis]|uniref:TcpE family conjugal transfer membrane protein n=1 Tax=Nocardiopsis valliformis TaxID=239974 RepID=UPI00034C6482|nr:TcpE family conjugal transfer membrane protein [Nocardiopsis valliformis]
MDLPTYTNIWRIEKRLYKLYDFRLPMPLPVGTFGVALGVFALWVVLLSIVNAPFDFGNGWHLVLWVVPPGVITVLATRPVIEGKRLTELLISQARFLTEARVYTRLAPEYEPAEVRVSVRVWHRHPEAGPLPLTRAAARRAQAEEEAALERAAEAEEAEAAALGELEGAEEAPVRGSGRRAAPEAAPPLRGVPTAEPEPVRAVEPVRAAEPAHEPAPVPDDDVEYTPARRVPVAAASSAHAPARSGTAPIQEDDAVAEPRNESEHRELAADASDLPADPPADRHRGVGRRMLNYFGFALGPDADWADSGDQDPGDHEGSGGHDRDHDRGHRPPERNLLDEDVDFGEPLYVTEEDEQRDRDQWFAQLRASSGETPLGLTSKGAYAASDTTAMSSAELADAVSPAEPGPAPKGSGERHRGEPEERTTEQRGEGSPAARRLRGRVQGIQVAKEHADRRERDETGEGTEAPEAAQQSVPVRERAQQTPPARTSKAKGRALPVTGNQDERPARTRRQGRPHATPWALDAEEQPAASSGQADYPGLSDYAARYAAASGRPSVAEDVAAAPWLPPASSAPEDEPREKPREESTARSEAGPQTSFAARNPDTAAPEPSTAKPSTPESGAAKPPLQLDHGTGEHEAMPVEPEEEDPAERGPEWSEHMSVLDQHLITADTPAPPRPKFADAVPSKERDSERRDPSEWFDDGKRRHPDQPKVGDKDNPVIAVSEIREERRAAAEAREQEAREKAERELRVQQEEAREQEERELRAREEAIRKEAEEDDRRAAEAAAAARVDEPKPSTQLDHGTGELVSFVEVRKDPRTPTPRSSATAYETTDPAPPVTSSGETTAASHPPEGSAATETHPAAEAPVRPTEAELAEAEAAALRARRAPAGTEVQDAPDRSDDLSRTMRSASPETTAEQKGSVEPDRAPQGADGDRTPPEAQDTHASHAAHGDREPHGAQDTHEDGGSHGAQDIPADAPASQAGPDSHDGVFHRVAQNARRIGQLFGQPTPGEEPEPSRRTESADDQAKPDLELDHGTGEQARLGDTPNGVPSHRPEPEPVQRAEEPEPQPVDSAVSGGTRGWRRLAKVVTGGAAPVRSDLPASDIERLRTPLAEPRSLVVLGCTGGAGQTVTALMIGHTLAAHRDDRVVAVDVNPGPNGLSRRVGAQAPETLTALLANADSVDEYERMRAYAGRAGTGLEVVQTLDDPYVQTLDDRDYGQLSNLLGGFYGVTLLDPAATGVARALPVADGLVLVAPASADAERAVSMTFEWLDGNGYANLRANSVLVVNGVSKRSLQDVDSAERVARGRCRAIVRIPWDDHLGASYTKIDVGALRPATKRAHGALGGVLVNALAPAASAT